MKIPDWGFLRDTPWMNYEPQFYPGSRFGATERAQSTGAPGRPATFCHLLNIRNNHNKCNSRNRRTTVLDSAQLPRSDRTANTEHIHTHTNTTNMP